MNIKKILKNYILIIGGSVVTAAGIALFITPAKLAIGGVSGIAVILYHLFSIDVGTAIFVLSIPLFIAGIKIFGRRYGYLSVLGTMLLSLFTSLMGYLWGFEGLLDYSDSINTLLSAIFGGLLIGFGTGLVLRGGANTGGTDIIAQIMSKYTPLAVGTSLFFVDGLILLSGGFIFGLESALFATLALYATSVSVNYVVLSIGTRYAKTALIISDQHEKIASRITNDLGHGATYFSGKGVYSQKDKPVLMTVIPNQKISALIAIVKDNDPSAFMIIEEAHEVIGEGFNSLNSH
ncbi:MAG: YitT family protein [Spirochaetia bacterium]|nr:YitT family protein [Spirochaetia bacterium]